MTKPVRSANLDVTVTGDPFEMGREQGARLRDRIRSGIGIVEGLAAFRAMKPAWMPMFLFRRAAQKRAHNSLAAPMERDYAVFNRRIEGIAAGAGVSVSSLYLISAMESVLSEKSDQTTVPALGGCSALAVRSGGSTLGEPVIVRNFDYMEAVQPLYSMRRAQPKNGFRTLDFTMAPLPGTVDGVNEKGLAITYNYAYTADSAARTAPISIVIAQALERCSNVEGAAAWIQARPRWGGALLMLADAEGDIASLELSSTRSALRRPGRGEDSIFHTNMFWTARMREIQIPDAAVYTEKAPSELRGRRLHESAIKRTAHIERRLHRQQGPMSLEDLGSIMADHGEAGAPDDTTVCVHGPYWQTTASLQVFPKSRRMRVAFDSACRAKHVEIVL